MPRRRRGVAHAAKSACALADHRLDQTVQRGTVALRCGREGKPCARTHDGNAVFRDGATDQIRSPGRQLCPDTRTVSGITPTPDVVMNSSVGLAAVYDLGVAGDQLAPPPRCTRPVWMKSPGRGSRREDPSSIIRQDWREAARAPIIARSFTVPHTASLPMSPPGKMSGETT